MDAVKVWPRWSLVYFKLGGKYRRGMITIQGPVWSEVFVNERWTKQRTRTADLLPVPLTGPDGSR